MGRQPPGTGIVGPIRSTLSDPSRHPLLKQFICLLMVAFNENKGDRQQPDGQTAPRRVTTLIPCGAPRPPRRALSEPRGDRRRVMPRLGGYLLDHPALLPQVL